MILGDIVKVKPAAGRLIPINTGTDAELTYLPKEGKKVILDKYWVRRLNAGEVTASKWTAPKPTKTKTRVSTKKKSGGN